VRVTGHGRRVLVVEDDADLRGALAAVLEVEGYVVVEAAHGAQALEQLRAAASTFCMILLDLFMPTMNGWAFRAEQMKDPDLAAIPVVVVSADATAATKARALGVVDYMTKPIDFDRLLSVVERHC
jgi:CheY-like chemotaxis protein